MATLADFVGFGAGEDVYEVARAEKLAGAENGRKRFSNRDGAVEYVRRAVAEVAMAAALHIFAEIG